MLLTLGSKKKAIRNEREVYKIKEKAKPLYLFNEQNDTIAILLHGFTGSPHDVRELADFLFDKGINVYSVRIAGHGTHIHDMMRTSYQDWLQSVENAVEAVENKHKRIFFGGVFFWS